LATFCASGATPKHVLILDSFGRDIAPFNIGTSAFRTTLARELGEPVDIYEASLDAARFAEPELEKPFVEFLKSRFESNRLDLVVPIGAPAVRFMAKYREALFAKTPVLFMAAEPRLISPTLLLTNATLVTQRVNPRGMVEDILQMRPDTRNIAVVLGASPLEMFWASQLQGDFLAFTNRVHFIWLNDLSLEQIEQRVASLPPHSFILFGMLVMDASGVPYDGNAPLQRLHTVANAPIFAYFGSQFGSGDIGGRMYQDTEVGMRAARAAIRILHGERPESIAPQILDAASPVYDWRELRRWNIDVTKLPPGSIVQFRQPNFWQLYRGRILVVTGIFVLQLGLIISLAISRARRIRAEKLARESEDRFRTVANSAPVLIWMAGVDKLCTFFNKPWLDFTGRTLEKEFGNGWVEGVHPEDRQQCVEAYEKAFDARQAFTLQYRLRRNDGDYRWISDHGLPRFDTHNSFAGYIGSCIDITELKEVERQQREFKGLLINAHEEERSRLARELHDDITQRLVRLAIDMGTAGLTPTGLKTDGERHTVREELVRLTDDVHALSYQLHPSILDYLGLVEALRTEADRFSRREAIAVDLQLDEIPSSLPPATALGLYRITQEALSNVACHAKATQVHIALKLSTTGITLSIRDNGIGFDAARRLLKPSLGLTGMKERANLVGGSIEIESQAEAGTIIRVQLPVTAITA
jgi:PAS domain S-box-containing protein